MGEKIYSLAEVSKHNTPKDCWLVINGKVYDVTKFLDDHPRGDDVLLSSTGKDATSDFDDVGHTSSAKSMMDEYLIGYIDASSIPSETKYSPPKQPHYDHDKSAEFFMKIIQFFLPLVILALAAGVRFYVKSE